MKVFKPDAIPFAEYVESSKTWRHYCNYMECSIGAEKLRAG